MTSSSILIRATPQPSVTEIHRLLDHLYLQPLSNILTLPLYEKRYADNQRQAVAIILEQSRRQVMASRDYRQIGLCHFHTGLIYCLWERHLDATYFFDDARLYWSLAGEQAYVCLALLAQAAAQHKGLQLEMALLNYEKVELFIPRLKRLLRFNSDGPRVIQISAFSDQIARLLVDLLPQLRREIWHSPLSLTSNQGFVALLSRPPVTPTPPPRGTATGYVETPRIHGDLLPVSSQSNLVSAEHKIPGPQLSGQTSPGDKHRWFQLVNSNSKFLPTLHTGDMVLVWLNGSQNGQSDDLLVTAGSVPQSIRLRPQIGLEQESDAYCLGRYIGSTESGAWVLFHQDQSPAAVPARAIVGYVTGQVIQERGL